MAAKKGGKSKGGKKAAKRNEIPLPVLEKRLNRLIKIVGARRER